MSDTWNTQPTIPSSLITPASYPLLTRNSPPLPSPRLLPGSGTWSLTGHSFLLSLSIISCLRVSDKLVWKEPLQLPCYQHSLWLVFSAPARLFSSVPTTMSAAYTVPSSSGWLRSSFSLQYPGNPSRPNKCLCRACPLLPQLEAYFWLIQDPYKPWTESQTILL